MVLWWWGSTVVILRCYLTQVVVGCPLELTQHKGRKDRLCIWYLGSGGTGRTMMVGVIRGRVGVRRRGQIDRMGR